MGEYYNVVPWYNAKEWNHVYDLLYSSTSSVNDKLEAFKYLLIWKVRCPSLPSGIESTLTLLEVRIQDLRNTDDTVTDHIVRLAYSSAIMRFANHMLDAETVKGSSLYQAAKNRGIPQWIVDLRHNTAHSNNLPSVEILREASIVAFTWLKEHYWDKHKPHIKDYVSGQNYSDKDENKIAALMNFCTSLSFCAPANCKIKHLAAIPDVGLKESMVSDIRDLFGDNMDLSNLKTVSITSLINLLNVQAKKFFNNKENVIHMNKALLGEESLLLSSELIKFMGTHDIEKRKKLKKNHVQCFEVLFTFLHTNDLILDFILELIKVTQDSESSNFKCLLCALWLSEIFAALRRSRQFMHRMKRSNFHEIKEKKRTELKLLYHHWFPNEKTSPLLLDLLKPIPVELTRINYIQPIISQYNPYLSYFIKNLLQLVEPQLPRSIEQQICTLAKLVSSPEMFPAATSRIYTVDDLKSHFDDLEVQTDGDSDDDDCEVLDDQTDTAENTSSTNVNKNIWQLASSEHSWSTSPIGRLPWVQSDDNDTET